jgi:hypothetical protein
MPTLGKHLISSQQSILVRFSNDALPPNNTDPTFTYLVLHQFIRQDDEQRMIIGIDYRIIFGISPKVADELNTTAEHLKLNPVLDYWRRYKLLEPISEDNEELIERAVSEADLRTRIAASDFLYTCGGETLRNLYIEIVQKAQIDEQQSDPKLST